MVVVVVVVVVAVVVVDDDDCEYFGYHNIVSTTIGISHTMIIFLRLPPSSIGAVFGPVIVPFSV